MKDRVRLNTDEKLRALALLARGDTPHQIAGHLKKEYGRSVAESTISGYKVDHKKTIDKMRETMIEAQAIDADAIMRRSRKLINKTLDRAERDSSILDELDEEYRTGGMSIQEYRRKKKGLITLSVGELVNVGKAMYEQTKTAPLPPDPNALSAGNNPVASGLPSPQLEAMLAAIASGNEVKLQQLIFNPKEAANVEPMAV